MKNPTFLITLLSTLYLSLNAQTTFDFQSGQDQYGWISGGGGITDADLSITSEGLVVSWSDPGVDNWQNGRKPKLKHTNANVDADMNKIFGITLHNTSNLVTRVRVIHFKGLNGTDPTSSSGAQARYASFDIPATTDAQETFYYDLTNADWVNYNNSIETETDLDMDHIQIQFVTASPANGFLTSEGSITIHSMSFINEIPSEERVDYNFSENVEGFIGQNGVSVSQSAGNLVLDISGTSPYPKLTQSGSFAVNADAYKYATVFLSENNSPKSRMTFVSPQGGNQFVSANITPNSTTAQEVNFDLSTLDNWNGMINNFAFQIIEPTEEGAALTSSGTVNIDRILFSPSPQIIPSYVPTVGLVAYYPFNGNANDESGNGNNGTVNGATLTSDRDGNENSAYVFDGVDDWIMSSIEQSASFSVSVWANINDNSTYNAFVQHKDNCVRGGGYILETDIQGYFRYLTNDCGSCSTSTCSNAFDFRADSYGQIQIGEWNLYTVTSDGLGNYKYYINNQLIGNISDPNVNIDYGVQPFSIGKHHDGQNLFYSNGILDDIGYWNRALTQHEITNLFNSEISLSTTDFSNSIIIYPNPVKNMLTIDGLVVKDVVIYSVLGKAVLKMSNQNTIDVSSLSKGVYFIKVSDGINASTKKFIKD